MYAGFIDIYVLVVANVSARLTLPFLRTGYGQKRGGGTFKRKSSSSSLRRTLCGDDGIRSYFRYQLIWWNTTAHDRKRRCWRVMSKICKEFIRHPLIFILKNWHFNPNGLQKNFRKMIVDIKNICFARNLFDIWYLQFFHFQYLGCGCECMNDLKGWSQKLRSLFLVICFSYFVFSSRLFFVK